MHDFPHGLSDDFGQTRNCRILIRLGAQQREAEGARRERRRSTMEENS
jgi:hypothetical protein